MLDELHEQQADRLSTFTSSEQTVRASSLVREVLGVGSSKHCMTWPTKRSSSQAVHKLVLVPKAGIHSCRSIQEVQKQGK